MTKKDSTKNSLLDDTSAGGENLAQTRRGFLHKSGLFAMSAALGGWVPFSAKMPAGLTPAAFAAEISVFALKGKEGLVVLNDRPINAETPAHLLDDDFTPAKYFFVRNNGLPPEENSLTDVENWTLEIAGESCKNPQSFSLAELKKKFKHHTYALT